MEHKKLWVHLQCISRHGTILWMRLQRDPPDTLAQVIRIADSYALGDPTQPKQFEQSPQQGGVGPSRQHDRQDFWQKRKEDHRYSSYQVTASEPCSEGVYMGSGDMQAQKSNFNAPKKPWG